MASNVDSVFERVLTSLRESIKTIEEQQQAGANRWTKLAEEQKIIDGFKHEEIATAFSRDGTSKLYSDAITPDSSYKEVQAAKVQGDILSAFERDSRMRYRSRVRMMAHGLARMKTHSLYSGPVFKSIMQYVNLLTDKGPSE